MDWRRAEALGCLPVRVNAAFVALQSNRSARARYIRRFPQWKHLSVRGLKRRGRRNGDAKTSGLFHKGKFHALTHGVDAVGADARAVTEVPFERTRFCPAAAARSFRRMAAVAAAQ